MDFRFALSDVYRREELVMVVAGEFLARGEGVSGTERRGEGVDVVDGGCLFLRFMFWA